MERDTTLLFLSRPAGVAPTVPSFRRTGMLLQYRIFHYCDIAINTQYSFSFLSYVLCGLYPTVTAAQTIEITRTSIAQGQEGSAILVETY